MMEKLLYYTVGVATILIILCGLVAGLKFLWAAL